MNQKSWGRYRRAFFFVPELLQQQNGFEALGSAVRDGVALELVAEGPSAQGGISPAFLHERRILLDLTIVQEHESLVHGVVVLLLQSQSRLDHTLDQQGRVPKLRTVGTVHHHSFARHPKIREGEKGAMFRRC